VPALDVLAMRQTPLDVVLGTHAPEPWTAEPLRMTAPVGAGRSVAMRSAHPRNAAMVAAVHEHLIRYRNRTGLTDAEIGRLARTVVREARRNDFDPGLVLAVMHVESRYDTFAVSPKDAMGLMQLLPSTGEWMAAKLGLRWEGPQTLFDPTANVRLGVAYLRELADRYGSLHTALSAYNWGPGHIDRRIATGAPLPRIYAELVFEAYGRAANRS
jgi:soluble lytic murein transglycosylase-like protein